MIRVPARRRNAEHHRAAPLAEQRRYIGAASNGGTVTQTAGAATIPTITFGGATSGWAGGTYNLNGGTLTAGSITQGAYGTGTFNLSGGWLRFSSGSTSMTGFATLTLNGGTVTSSNTSARYIFDPLSLSGNLTFGSVTTYTGVPTFYGAVTLNGDVALTLNKGLILNGSISGSHGITTAGANTLQINGANTWTGPLTIGAGSNVTFGAPNGGFGMRQFVGHACRQRHVAGVISAGTLTLTGNNSGFTGNTYDQCQFARQRTLCQCAFWSGTSTSAPAMRVPPIKPSCRQPNTFTLANSQIVRGLYHHGQLLHGHHPGDKRKHADLRRLNRQQRLIDADSPLKKDGPGTLVLPGSNTYSGSTTIVGGTLQIGDGGGAGTLWLLGPVVNSAAALVFNRNDTPIVNNNISGTGSVAQKGSGTLQLTGSNSYTGLSIVQAGVMELGTAAQGPVLTEPRRLQHPIRQNGLRLHQHRAG